MSQVIPNDGQLLRNFAANGGNVPFAELVRRHSPMVLSLCSRMLANRQDAEDAAQAVFLALARKAGALGREGSVSGWLYRAALCAARNAYKARRRRQAREEEAGKTMIEERNGNGGDETALAALREALAELPEKYRLPIVLHHLEGKSCEAAAELVGCAPATLAMRLTRGREMLRSRMARRGLAVSASAIAGLLTKEAVAAEVSEAFVTATVKLACGWVVAGQAAAGAMAVPAQVAELTKGVLKMILWTKIKTAAAMTLAVGLGAALVVAAANLTPEKTAPGKVSSIAPATPEKPAQPATAAPAEAVKALAQANNEFALEMYAQLKGEPGNLFFSPFSLRTALGMTYAGAKGETAAQMEKALRFKPQDPNLHAAFAQTIKDLEPGEKGGYKLTVANSLWGQKDYKWLQPFLETCKANYGSGLTEVDFKTAFEEARVKINKWVEEKTNEKIKDLIPVGGLNNLTCLVLVNAIWFKGDWKSQFKKEATKDEPFWNSGTEKVTAPLMHQKQDFKYLEAEGVQLLEMPYVGEKVSMVVILPKEKAGLGKVEAGLTGVKLEQWLKTLDQARAQEVQVYLPKFTLTYGTKEMMKSFEALGMTLPFQGGSADFSGMDGQKGLCISKIFHKAFVAVDEEGTEAAAATAVVMTRTSVPPPPPVFRADHPFVFLIRDKTNGNILFLGRLAKP